MSAAWLDWWRRFIHVEGATERGEYARVADSDAGRAQQRAAVFAVFDPPEFATLADSPSLQRAARQVCNQALQWKVEHRAVAPDRRSAWLAQKAVAESVIEEYQVSPSRVSAGVIVLEVSGQWSNIPEPGVLLCSSEFFVDSEAVPSRAEADIRDGTAPAVEHVARSRPQLPPVRLLTLPEESDEEFEHCRAGLPRAASCGSVRVDATSDRRRAERSTRQSTAPVRRLPGSPGPPWAHAGRLTYRQFQMGKTVGCRPASRHDRGDHPARSPTPP